MTKMTKIKNMSKKRAIERLDYLNKDNFEYIGILHDQGGSKNYIWSVFNFLDSLEVKPQEKIKIYSQGMFDDSVFMTIVVHNTYMYIYKLEDVKDKIDVSFSKKKCILVLDDNGNEEDTNIV
jgi:hypothetical protein